jgi:hypothetical protein
VSARPPRAARARALAFGTLLLALPAAARGPLPPEVAAAAHAAHATPLARLFFTPQERARIDAGAAPPEDAAVGAPPAPLRLDGVLRREDGSEVVWLDGRPADGGRAADDTRAQVAADGTTVNVRRPGLPPVTLRPGQTSDTPELGAGNRVELHR